MTDLSALCWAKFDSSSGGWMSVEQHLVDTGAIAALLWERWLPSSIRNVIDHGVHSAADVTVLELLAALHDVGKISPAFAQQARPLWAGMAAGGLPGLRDAHGQNRELPHARAGGWAVLTWLTARGVGGAVANDWASIIAAHHGVTSADNTEPADHLLGRGVWETSRDAVIGRAFARATSAGASEDVLLRPLTLPAQVLLSAVVIVADWLASNVELFPLTAGPLQVDRADTAWERLALPPPWQPTTYAVSEGFWAERFSFRDDQARPVQRAVAAMIEQAAAPRLVIVEDSMGSGKTEAALAAAELLASRCGSGGLIVALPTMATSDAMFSRVLRWLDRLPRTADVPLSVFLAHGKAGLNDEFAGLHDGRLRGVDDDGAGVVVAHEWLSGRKKGLLSSFVVGTIDQVLIGALRHRHLVLRHLALAGKVVVIDEVHASDPFMSVYLVRILQWLGQYGVPTVLLSATLPPSRRAELIAAYTWKGTTRTGRRRGGQPPEPTAAPGTGREAPLYPLVTIVDGSEVRSIHVPSSRGSADVRFRRMDDGAVVSRLHELLENGGVAAVVCNTVTRAQQAARELRQVLPEHEVVLLHSRFLASDRQLRERDVRAALGPPSADASTARPTRMVLVGTQVLEQSLDVDADVMIVDLAPADLLLQRIGRLHRHDRPARPAAVRSPVCLVRGVEAWAARVPRGVAGSREIYGESALMRTASVLAPFLDGQPFRLPDDIAAFVRDAFRTYDHLDPAWPQGLAAAEATARAVAADLQNRAGQWRLGPPDGSSNLFGLLSEGRDAEEADGQAAVRDGVQGLEVLLLEDAPGGLRLPWWVEGGAPLPDQPGGALAKAALGCAVRLPDWATSAALARRDLLQPPTAWQDDRWLRNTLVLRCSAAGEALVGQVGPLSTRYDRTDGLTVTRGPM